MSESCETDVSQTCKAKACAIQDCLLRNGYNESKCTTYIDDLYKCCKEFYEEHGSDAKSVCCPKFNLLQLKLQQRSLGKIDANMIKQGRA
ncbi:CMC4 [Candida margitis]|uniref:CMC4 n=1 Tax=Candida margitis TaxID=1775924 RepID=UPI0022264A40|nr:CMC4 [Candida margitis]KAI5953942.1 CMC4 [Candida margitis]